LEKVQKIADEQVGVAARVVGAARMMNCPRLLRVQANSIMSTTLPMTIGRPKSSGRPGTSSGGGVGPTASLGSTASASEEKYREVIVRLKKLLDMERENLKQVCLCLCLCLCICVCVCVCVCVCISAVRCRRLSSECVFVVGGIQVRQSFASELQQRTELEVFLRQCVEDVRGELARKRDSDEGALCRRVWAAASVHSSCACVHRPTACWGCRGSGQRTPEAVRVQCRGQRKGAGAAVVSGASRDTALRENVSEGRGFAVSYRQQCLMNGVFVVGNDSPCVKGNVTNQRSIPPCQPSFPGRKFWRDTAFCSGTPRFSRPSNGRSCIRT
jgi:hypothetical protein